jgi:hypothetical protein
MAWLIAKNLAQSSLASAYTAGDTTITVQAGDGAKFDAPGSGNTIALAIGNPVRFFLKATAISTDTFTVDSSGYDGSTAVGVTAATQVTEVVTGGVLADLLAAAGGGSGPTVLGTAYWSASGGAVSGLVMSGIISSVTRSGTGLFDIGLTSGPSVYTIAVSGSDDNVAAFGGYIHGTAITSSGFTVGTIGFTPVALRDCGVNMLTIFSV